MKRFEPTDEALLAARIMRANCAATSATRDVVSGAKPISPYTAASLAMRLCGIERAQRRHGEHQCNGDYNRPGCLAHAEANAGKLIDRKVAKWQTDLGFDCDVELQGDPRGSVLLLKLPGESEAL